MKITNDEVLYVANLARLNLTPEVTAKFAGQISQILDYIDQLNEVDTAGVKAATAVQIVNAFREDEVKPSLTVEESLANAPLANGSEFIVPKVIG